MAYIHRPKRVSRASQMSGLAGIVDDILGVITGGGGSEIEMDEEFVGNVNNLPLCSSSAVATGAWCRNYVGGSAIKKAALINTPAGATTQIPAPAKPAAPAPTTQSPISAFFAALTGSIGTNTMTPAATGPIVPPASSGMSTTTKLALAAGAVGIVALIASRR